jgi:hypothetical protein
MSVVRHEVALSQITGTYGSERGKRATMARQAIT